MSTDITYIHAARPKTYSLTILVARLINRSADQVTAVQAHSGDINVRTSVHEFSVSRQKARRKRLFRANKILLS